MNTEDEKVLALLILFVVGGAALPVILPRVGHAVSTWTLDHSILVPKADAIFTMPGLSAGPDLRRLVVLALLLIAAAFVAHAVKAKATRP